MEKYFKYQKLAPKNISFSPIKNYGTYCGQLRYTSEPLVIAHHQVVEYRNHNILRLSMSNFA